MKAFRRALKDVPSASDTAVTLHVTGDAGGTWSVAAADGWSVFRGEAANAVARARCDEDTAWRLFFNALSKEEARRRIKAEGDELLVEKSFEVRGVMA